MDRLGEDDYKLVCRASRKSPAERNYWPNELEVVTIVCVVRKIRHLIEATETPPAIIYTDHSAAVQIAKHTTLSTASTDRQNLRLVRASQYPSRFNLMLRHKSGKLNTVPDALSRLPQQQIASSSPDPSEGVLEALYVSHEPRISPPSSQETHVFHITLVELFDTFRARLVSECNKDEQWRKILNIMRGSDSNIRDSDRKLGLRFKLREDLIYYINFEDGRQRL